ncbi:hypothetical protein F5876DRAFT_85016 [Lentinula aff. lateritia]|uniref:Uncharacterized protein n=1 Tax=Lentinula aff. lateritia TaxID=2804960 RepID=A0ACC1TG75_9AGAR|nr:hypothetical protein F5876DRAFT_85016 [Lentinula aff. lateritia]
MEAAHFIHAELHLRSLSSIQWFFANAAEREEGIYRLVLTHSRFSDDAPFLNIAQHAGFIAPFSDSLEPPLHRRMFALETALPHHGAGNWEDLVPAVPSLDTLMQEWEAMMSSYIHFVTEPPSPQRGPQGEGSAHHKEVSALQEREGGGQKKGSVRPEGVSALQEGEGGVTAAIPLFLPEPLSPTPVASAASPPSPPPRFGSVSNLVIDMTADEDDDDIYESLGSIERRNHSEGNPVSREYHGVIAPVGSSLSSFKARAPCYLSRPPPHLPVLPAPAKPIADAMVGVSSDVVDASFVEAQSSPPYLPILPRS